MVHRHKEIRLDVPLQYSSTTFVNLSHCRCPGCAAMDVNKIPVCKGSLGWMFTRLDRNYDLHLDQSELAGLGPEKEGVCTKAFLRSCDLGRDQLISSKEWCSCFQRHQGKQTVAAFKNMGSLNI